MITDIIGYIFITVWLPKSIEIALDIAESIVIPVVSSYWDDQNKSYIGYRVAWVCGYYVSSYGEYSSDYVECYFRNLFKSYYDNMIY